MEKIGPTKFAKYYDKFDLLVSADNATLTVDFKVFKKNVEHNTRQFAMAGQIKAFELIAAKSTLNESYWLCVVLDLTEPTFYLWNYEIRPESSTLKELSKIEMGHYSIESLCCPSSDMSLKVYAISPEILLEITLPEPGSNLYTLKEISSKPNHNSVFDAFKSKLVIPTDAGYGILNTETGGIQHLCDKSAVMVKFSRKGEKIAVAFEGVTLDNQGKKHQGD